MNKETAAGSGAVGAPVEPTVRPGLPVIGCVWSGMVWLVSLRSPVKMDLGARLYTEAELDAAVARERGRCAELCDLAESAAWALWDTEADPSDQGKAIQAAALAAQIRGA